MTAGQRHYVSLKTVSDGIEQRREERGAWGQNVVLIDLLICGKVGGKAHVDEMLMANLHPCALESIKMYCFTVYTICIAYRM